MLSMCSEETVKEQLLEGAEAQLCGWWVWWTFFSWTLRTQILTNASKVLWVMNVTCEVCFPILYGITLYIFSKENESLG